MRGPRFFVASLDFRTQTPNTDPETWRQRRLEIVQVVE